MKINGRLRRIYNKSGLAGLKAFNTQVQSILSWHIPHFKNNMAGFKRALSTGYLVYDLQPRNKDYLASMVSCVTNCRYEEILRYIQEIDNDALLQNHFVSQIGDHPYLKRYYGRRMYYGRRAGWYAVVRALKPKVVVETGVAAGIGACVLTAALMKNAQEGQAGFYYGMEIDPQQGIFF